MSNEVKKRENEVEVEESNVQDFRDISVTASDFQNPLLSELLNTSFIIRSIVFKTGLYGEYALVDIGNGIYRTSSGVLLDQLRRIDQHLNTGKVQGIRVTLKKKKNYYYFT